MKSFPISKDYVVSAHGTVYSKRSLKFLSQTKTRKGYLRVGIRVNGSSAHFMVHRMVALTYIPNPDSKKQQVNHINGIKTDNRVENLEWCDGSGNQQHAYNLGLKVQYTGENHGRAKLTWDKVRQIRSLHAKSHTPVTALAKQFGVSKSNIQFILNNTTWVS